MRFSCFNDIFFIFCYNDIFSYFLKLSFVISWNVFVNQNLGVSLKKKLLLLYHFNRLILLYHKTSLILHKINICQTKIFSFLFPFYFMLEMREATELNAYLSAPPFLMSLYPVLITKSTHNTDALVKKQFKSSSKTSCHLSEIIMLYYCSWLQRLLFSTCANSSL